MVDEGIKMEGLQMRAPCHRSKYTFVYLKRNLKTRKYFRMAMSLRFNFKKKKIFCQTKKNTKIRLMPKGSIDNGFKSFPCEGGFINFFFLNILLRVLRKKKKIP